MASVSKIDISVWPALGPRQANARLASGRRLASVCRMSSDRLARVCRPTFGKCFAKVWRRLAKVWPTSGQRGKCLHPALIKMFCEKRSHLQRGAPAYQMRLGPRLSTPIRDCDIAMAAIAKVMLWHCMGGSHSRWRHCWDGSEARRKQKCMCGASRCRSPNGLRDRRGGRKFHDDQCEKRWRRPWHRRTQLR